VGKKLKVDDSLQVIGNATITPNASAGLSITKTGGLTGTTISTTTTPGYLTVSSSDGAGSILLSATTINPWPVWITGNTLFDAGNVDIAGGNLIAEGDIYTNEFGDYSLASSPSGWGSYTHKFVGASKLGKIVDLDINLDGVSNSTTASITVPWAARNDGEDQTGFIQARDSSTVYTGWWKLPANSTTMSFSPFYSATWRALAAWHNTAYNKSVWGNIRYFTD
jgi:hypothetical protein